MMGFAGRVGIVIEVAPGKFISYRLRADEAMITTDQDTVDTWSGGMIRKVPFGPPRVRIEVSGYVLAEEETAAPSWAEEPQGEIGARRELPAAPQQLEG